MVKVNQLEILCRNFLNISEDINFLEIIKFLKKYDGYEYNVFFLINYNSDRRLIKEKDIEEKDKDQYYILGFTPKPGLSNNPEKYILYCKFFNKSKWEYLKIETNKETTEEIKKREKKTITVLVYTFV